MPAHKKASSIVMYFLLDLLEWRVIGRWSQKLHLIELPKVWAYKVDLQYYKYLLTPQIIVRNKDYAGLCEWNWDDTGKKTDGVV